MKPLYDHAASMAVGSGVADVIERWPRTRFGSPRSDHLNGVSGYHRSLTICLKIRGMLNLRHGFGTGRAPILGRLPVPLLEFTLQRRRWRWKRSGLGCIQEFSSCP